MTMTVDEWRRSVNQNIQDHQRKLQNLSSTLAALERKLTPLFRFWMERQILIILRNDGKPRTWPWITRRLGYDAWVPLQRLIQKGLLTTVKSAHHTLYTLAGKKESAT